MPHGAAQATISCKQLHVRLVWALPNMCRWQSPIVAYGYKQLDLDEFRVNH